MHEIVLDCKDKGLEPIQVSHMMRRGNRDEVEETVGKDDSVMLIITAGQLSLFIFSTS